MKQRWHRYHYKNVTYVGIGLLVAYFLFQNTAFHSFLFQLGNIGYIGAFFAGMLFVSTFTVAAGSVMLLTFAEKLNLIEIGLIAGLGAVLGDIIVFQFMRSKGLADEVKHFFEYFGGDKLSHLLHTKYFSWSLPVLGALIIASPLPDELGVGLMGISKLKTYQFVVLSFTLNFLGIISILMLSTFIKP